MRMLEEFHVYLASAMFNSVAQHETAGRCLSSLPFSHPQTCSIILCNKRDVRFTQCFLRLLRKLYAFRKSVSRLVSKHYVSTELAV